MKHEFYDIAFRKKLYHSLEQLQADVGEWLVKYNQFRSHSVSRCYGKMPLQTFEDAKKLAEHAQLENLYLIEQDSSKALVGNSLLTEHKTEHQLTDNISVG